MLQAKRTGALPATSEKYQTSCHNGTSASTLAPSLNFSWDIITTRRNHSGFTDAYEIPKILKCPKLSQKTISDNVTNLMHNPWENFSQDWVRHRRMLHAPSQTDFRNHPEQQQKHLQDEEQAARKCQILKHISHDAIFMFRRALNISLWKIWMATILFLKEKLTRMENED